MTDMYMRQTLGSEKIKITNCRAGDALNWAWISGRRPYIHEFGLCPNATARLSANVRTRQVSTPTRLTLWHSRVSSMVLYGHRGDGVTNAQCISFQEDNQYGITTMYGNSISRASKDKLDGMVTVSMYMTLFQYDIYSICMMQIGKS